MNKEFKVGDVVVLVEEGCLGPLETILAKEKHLFEMTGWGYGGEVGLKSISTRIKVRAYMEDIKHATLKEQFLRTGNSIIVDDIGYLVAGDSIVGLKGGFYTESFNDNLLTLIKRKPITKVFSNLSNEFESRIDENNVYTTVLWEREHKPKIELTSEEITMLKIIDKKYKYIARDKYDDRVLAVYEEEPIKNDDNDMYVVGDAGGDLVLLYALEHLFQDITFESGAHLISDLIKENEK